jgi:hypothetical protein
MAFRPMTTLRHVIAALVLVIAVMAGIEFWMRSRATPTIQMVTSQTSEENQLLLVPSEARHHDLRKNSTVSLRSTKNGPAHVVRVNSQGCRGEEVEIPARPGTYRILFLGDDTICGTAVDESETVTSRLQQFLSKETTAEIEVINGGVPGYCPLLSWLKFEQDLVQLKPQLVILHVDMTDIADDACYRGLIMADGGSMECQHASFRLKSGPENALMHYVRQSAIATWLFATARHYAPELLSVSSATASCDVGLNWIIDDPPDLRLQVRHALAPIRDLQDAVKQSGGRFLVTTSPVLWQVLSADEAPELSRRMGIKGVPPFTERLPFDIVRAFCEQSRIHYCDASPSFKGENAGKLFSKDAPVLSRIGMALYAREIARSLISDPPTKWSE